MNDEQIELQRLCHQRTVDNHENGRRFADHATLADAHAFLAKHPPLNRPLGDGAPLDLRLKHMDKVF